MGKIILASNGKDSCIAAENFAIKECQRSEASLDIVHLVDCSLEHYGQIDPLATEIDKKAFVKYIKQLSLTSAKEMFSPLLLKARERNIKVELHLVNGKLDDCLAEIACQDDLIIIGGKKSLFFPETARLRNLTKKLDCKVRHVA